MKAALFFAHMEELGRNVGAERSEPVYLPSYRMGGELTWHYYGVRLRYGPRLTIGVLLKSRRAVSARAAAEAVAFQVMRDMPKIARAVRKATR